MNSDLMHPAGARFAENDAGLAVVGQPLELCPAVFAFWRDATHTDLVANHLNWFVTHDVSARKFQLKKNKTK